MKEFEKFSAREKKYFGIGAIAGVIISLIMSLYVFSPIVHAVLRPVHEFFSDTVGRAILEIATSSGRYDQEQRRKGIDDAVAHSAEDVGGTRLILTFLLVPLGTCASAFIGKSVAVVRDKVGPEKKSTTGK